MKIVSVVGARPQFCKLKPIVEAIKQYSHEHIIIHTGQHYDVNLSDIFFEGLSIPCPDVNLSIGSGTHGQQTGEMLKKIETEFIKYSPDWVLVYGDTNSTLAGALAASKVGISLAHVEAGLRSFNKTMPEEINRVLTDHTSDLLFAPTTLAMQNLEREGLSNISYLVGDVMADLLNHYTKPVINGVTSEFRKTNEDYVVATVHRASNTDDREQLNRILTGLTLLESRVVVVAHPRLVGAINKFNIILNTNNIELLKPLGYLQMIDLVRNSKGVITDSGGLQKEAFLIGVPCITLRTETEWPETFQGNMNVLDPSAENLSELIQRQVSSEISTPYGDGNAATKIIEMLENYESERLL